MSTPNSLFKQKMKDPEFAKLMAEESLILEVTEKIVALMQDQNISKTELANRLGKSKGFITQLLDGTRNFTIKTIADIFHVLGYSLEIQGKKYITQEQNNCTIIEMEQYLEFNKKGNYFPADDKSFSDLDGVNEKILVA